MNSQIIYGSELSTFQAQISDLISGLLKEPRKKHATSGPEPRTYFLK